MKLSEATYKFVNDNYTISDTLVNAESQNVTKFLRVS